MSSPKRSLVLALLAALSASFLLGALTHAGVRVPLGFVTLDEPTIVPAAIVEAIIAGAFAVAAFAELAGRPYARLALRLALRVGIAGVLLGMFALALGRGTRTELNDVFHVVVLIVMLVALRLTWRTGPGGVCRPGRRLARRAT
jgi:H+/Cl- antiporter ClcA